MTAHLQLLSEQQFNEYVAERPGEFKLGQKIGHLLNADALSHSAKQGYRFALIGIPEQIGPMANCGKGGAQGGWHAFLRYFLNLQSNRFLAGDDILLVGQVTCDDLPTSGSVEQLREQCEALDERVYRVMRDVFAAGLIPIVIGGGHNNAYPIIKACAEVSEMPLAVCNLDPHSDFRQQESRHSGNPFRYAYNEGHLKRYAVLGLHEQKNSDDALNELDKAEFPYYSIQQTHWRREMAFDHCLERATRYLLNAGLPIGAELDLDAISEMPTSAMTRCGIPLTDALYYVANMAQLPDVRYLHLAEGAPARHASSIEEGERIVGQSLAELACAFIKALPDSE